MAKIKKFIFILSAFCILYLLLNGQIFCPVLSAPELASGLTTQRNAEALSAQSNNTTAPKDNHIVNTTLESVFKADDATIWHTLIDFQKYPSIFKRIKSVEITKRDGDLVYIESHLEPHAFVKKIVQHMVNDLSAGPKILSWRMLDGNFKYVHGKWQLEKTSSSSCKVVYTLSVDLGPLIPAPLINFVVHHVQQEIVSDLKRYVEAEYKKQDVHKIAALIRC